MRPALLHSDRQPPSALVIPKLVTLNSYFTLHSAFVPVFLELLFLAFQNNYVKTNANDIFARVLRKGGVKRQWGRVATHVLLWHTCWHS